MKSDAETIIETLISLRKMDPENTSWYDHHISWWQAVGNEPPAEIFKEPFSFLELASEK